MNLKAPFPWFGGKSRAAHLVWERFGDIPNYVEPFAGSLAVLLARPSTPRTETVNDKDCFLSNFWRAIKLDPEATARWCDWPVNECDLLARHRWLDRQHEFVERMKLDPDYFDAKIAGWWVWGLCSWIGVGWCRQRGEGEQPEKLPHLGDAGMGINRKLPHLGDAGRDAGIFRDLSDRLRNVRISCGEWDRITGESVTVKHGLTGVFLDPPYSMEDRDECYSVDDGGVAQSVREWAIANGDNPLLRIALCGYSGEHRMPRDWSEVPWKATGGYGSQSDGQGRANSKRERIWFSPHCLQPDLFSMPSQD